MCVLVGAKTENPNPGLTLDYQSRSSNGNPNLFFPFLPDSKIGPQYRVCERKTHTHTNTHTHSVAILIIMHVCENVPAADLYHLDLGGDGSCKGIHGVGNWIMLKFIAFSNTNPRIRSRKRSL